MQAKDSQSWYWCHCGSFGTHTYNWKQDGTGDHKDKEIVGTD